VNGRGIARVIVSGLVAGLLVAGVMAFLDWRVNPGGLFHDSSGTDWLIVRATAWSWFWPIALLVAAIAAPIARLLLGQKTW
jgi:phosphotransferase system  glucose/maltose/N-acetylglucosamine-specific IIC component